MSVGTPPSAVTPGVVARSHSAPLWPHIGSFAAGDIEYHPRGTLEPLRTRQCGNDKGANAALHVGHATSPQPAVLHETAVGRHAPGLGPERNGIGVAGKGDRRPVASAAHVRNEIGASLGKRRRFTMKAGAGEKVPQVFGAGCFLTRRVDGVEADPDLVRERWRCRS